MKENFDFDIMLNMIRDGQNFSYSRFGDGEWSAVLQNRKEGSFNCDGHNFFPEMGERLKKIVESKPSYWIGMQNLAKEQNQDNPEFQRLYQINDWTDNEVLTRASIRGQLEAFFNLIDIISRASEQKIILVGNNSLRQLNKLQVNSFIEIPDKNCWLEYERIRKEVFHSINYSEDENAPIVLYCASMMSNILIDDMFEVFTDTITQIDCGSVFDPYIGRMSRSYMKKLKL